MRKDKKIISQQQQQARQKAKKDQEELERKSLILLFQETLGVDPDENNAIDFGKNKEVVEYLEELEQKKKKGQ
jgi:hypothetical protein